jgi:hypothetical protein
LKKYIIVLVIFLLLIPATIFSIGYGSRHQTYTINTNAYEKLLKPMQEGAMLQRGKEKLGIISPLNENNTLLNLVIKTKQLFSSQTVLEVSGNGFLKFENSRFPFTVDSSKSHLYQIDNNGELILVGLIIGEIRGNNLKTEELTINVIYSPSTENGQFSVVVGVAGDEVILPYGNPFVNQDLMNLIEEKIYNN